MTLQEWMDLKTMNDADLERELEGRVSRSQISRIRRGKCRPSIETAKVLEHLTKIPAATFVMGEAA